MLMVLRRKINQEGSWGRWEGLEGCGSGDGLTSDEGKWHLSIEASHADIQGKVIFGGVNSS